MRKTLKNVFANNYWRLCQNHPSWDICLQKKLKETVADTFTADT